MSVSQSVCLFVPSFWPNLRVDFSETWNDDRFWPNLNHGLKNLENGYHGNMKKPNMIFWLEKLLELQI